MKLSLPFQFVSVKKRSFHWHYTRLLIKNDRPPRPFSRKSGFLNVLLITEEDKICQSQIFPFHFYKTDLLNNWKIELKEVRLKKFEKDPSSSPKNADIVLLQTWFDISEIRLTNIISSIKTLNPDAKLVFLDSFAPTDLRLAQWLNNNVDIYLKKHVLRDRTHYSIPTRGDTNLVDYYGRLYDLPYSEKLYPIPEGFLDKLLVGPSFMTAPYMLPYFTIHEKPWRLPSKFDVHGRLAFKGSDWYQMMRSQAIEKIVNLNDCTTLSTSGVNKRQYFNELRSSKICFSPFGYGEVCWRDYEAVLCGSLLVKPDMSHLETDPDIFKAHETYVPIQWDFSDFNEIIHFYLKHEKEREKIAQRAYTVLHEYCKTKRFVQQVKPLFTV